MTDDKLDRLKALPVPPPRPQAKAAAVAAAHAAFQAAGIGAGTDAETEKLATAPQGIGGSARLRDIDVHQTRKLRMRTSSYYAMAASVAAIAVAAPVAWHIMQGSDRTSAPPETGILARQMPKDDKRKIAPQVAEKPAATQPSPKPQDSITVATSHDKVLADGMSRATGAVATTKRPEKARDETLLATPGSAVSGPLPPRQETRPAGKPARLDAERSRMATLPLAGSEVAGGVRTTAPMFMGSQQGLTSGFADRGGRGAVVAAMPSPRHEPIARPLPEQHRDTFAATQANPVKSVAAEPVSTFSIDVDTASHAFVRRSLNAGRLPPKAAVRTEEMINYFPYDYPKPDNAGTPFRPTVEVMTSPWNAANKLVHIAIKGYDLKPAERPRANLVFLVDVSGSMAPHDRLPLVRNALRMLVDNLQPEDTVAIVTYASGSGVALEPTRVSDKARILAAIDSLRAGGSTAGAAGIEDAYRIAEAGFDKAAVNRVILATDGDFNVGITDRDALKGFVERKRRSGILLSILGVGRGNYNDALMQTLAQNGNGTAAYVDTLAEARKLLVEEASSTLFTIARDVKIQLEFNPQQISEYRLIGYETRMLNRADFNNDKVDAGDVGSGHTITAIYEVTPADAPKLVDDLRYRQPAAAPLPAAANGKSGEIGFLKLRYKLPNEEASRLATFAIGAEHEKRDVAQASREVRFSVAVAAFGQLLRGLPYMKDYTYDDVIALANGARGDDPYGYRAEFVNLVRLAKSARP